MEDFNRKPSTKRHNMSYKRKLEMYAKRHNISISEAQAEVDRNFMGYQESETCPLGDEDVLDRMIEDFR